MLNEPTDKEQVEIRPGIGLYALFPSLRYSPWVALGEMVDNSIQSYLEHKEELLTLHGPDYKLRVDINFSGGDNPIMLLGYLLKTLQEHLHLQCLQQTKQEFRNMELV